MITSLFVDGGLIGKNPSDQGGTWAYCLVDEFDKLIKYNSGLILPEDVGQHYFTNNFTELYAAVRGLSAVPEGWDGNVYTDSQVTLRRIHRSVRPKFNGVPDWLRKRVLQLRLFGRYRVGLLKGHPTKEQLLNQWADGRPVSKWNVFCDKLCNDRVKEFLNGVL